MFSVCSHGGGGVPISHNALQHYPECHGAAGGVPCQVQLGGYPGGGDPGGVPWQGGYPARGGRGGTQVGQHRSTCYTAGGMPVAFTQEDFLVYHC